MNKFENLVNQESCFNKAKDEETLFVLLERDPAAAVAVRGWIEARLILGLNKPNDKKIKDAWDIVKKFESKFKCGKCSWRGQKFLAKVKGSEALLCPQCGNVVNQ
jgi:hypothetical protein